MLMTSMKPNGQRRKPLMLYTYPGGKYRLAEKYRKYYPPHHHFVSLFGGSGAEIMCKDPSPLETFNDLDDLVYGVFAVLQDKAQRAELLRLLANTLDSRKQYEECHRIINGQTVDHSMVRRAWAYLVCANIGYHGPHAALTHSYANCSRAMHSATTRLLRLPDTIRQWRDRFRRVHVESQTWQRTIQQYDRPDTFFFTDPPYHPHVCAQKLYRHEMTDEQHVELLEVMNRVQGFVMLCGINHPLYEEHLFHWRRFSFNVRTTMNGSKNKPHRKEEIWLNYEADGSKVHDHRHRVTERYVNLMGSMEEAERQLQRRKDILQLPK